MNAPVVRVLGRVEYAPTAEAMRDFTESRTQGTPDEIWLCEHPPVYTQGLAGKAEHVLAAHGIPVVQTNRGGQVTYHGPGQVVAYPLVDLKRLGIYVKEYVYRLEQAVIKTLEHYDVTGHRVRGAPGIYVRLADPGAHAVLASAAAGAGPVRRPGQDRRARHQGQPALHLPRRGAERGDGPAALRRHQPLRLRRACARWTFLQSASRRPGTAVADTLGRKLAAYLSP